MKSQNASDFFLTAKGKIGIEEVTEKIFEKHVWKPLIQKQNTITF